MAFDNRVRRRAEWLSNLNTLSPQTRRPRVAATAGILLAALMAVSAPQARAQDQGIIAKGDAAVTAFSGSLRAGNVPKGVHPLDVTTIDLAKPSLQVFDLSKLGGPPSAQLADAPSKFQAKAGEIGQVFGVTLDDGGEKAPPNIYAGASSLFGLQIVENGGKGAPLRLVKGAPNAAWMPGQFGLDKGGGPSSIWKIDGKSGEVSLFSTITSGSFENAGPGLAGLAFDPVSHQIFAASLETGLIHSLDMAGREAGTFDHGIDARSQVGLAPVADDASKRMDIHSRDFSVEDVGTWGYADARRRVVALAVESGRLYYSVAEGPVVWSVGLTADGAFAADPRLELDVIGTPNGNMITAIAFDGPEKMYLTQRGDTAGSYDYGTFARPQASVVYRYTFDTTAKSWKEAPEEFANGLEAPHRATTGGIAFNYGYDKNGNIDLGACHETLWTTGEHLRNGDGTSDPRTVHGLQGNYKDLAKPVTAATSRSGSSALNAGGAAPVSESALKPPNATWFTDWDGTYEDTNTHGPIGQIAIFEKCDKRAVQPTRSAVPGAPKKPIPGIYIDKTCAPVLFGAQTVCEITVRNTGIPQTSPVSFTDSAVILPTTGFGVPLTATTVTPDGPDFICSGVPALAVACILPSGALPPGSSRKVTVLVNTAPPFDPSTQVFQNCATLDAPYHGQACFNSNAAGPGGGLTLAKSGPATCAPGGACTFTLTVKNSSGLPLSGNVLISDGLLLNGVTPTAAPVTAVVPPMGCVGGEPAALPISCVAPMSLAPGASKTFKITATMPPGNFWAQNCFALTAPGSPPADISASGSCAWVKVGNPPPLANLAVLKSATGCGKTNLNTVRCTFAITLTNTGPTPFNGPVSLSDTTPATATVGSQSAAWQCVGAAPNVTCNSAAAVSLAPGQSTSFPIFADTPKAVIDAVACLVPNTAAILAPPVGSTNFKASDDSSTALADAALLQFFDPVTGLTTVLCDPTNLKTTKVKNGDCVEGGGGFVCKYTVTITNTGPDPYKGPLNVTEQLDETPTSVAFDAPGWTCNGAGPAFQCTKPPFELAKGDSVSFNVTANLPKSGQQCVAKNTAILTFPLSGTRWNGDAADDSATAVSLVPRPECNEKPVCDKPGDGEIQSRSGACVCDADYTRSRDGQCLAAAQVPAAQPTPDTCPDGNPMPRSGSCPCPSGKNWNAEKASCEAACEPGPNEYRTSAGICLCKTGYLRNGDDVCIDDRGTTPPPIRLVPTPEREECGYNETYVSDRCVCRSGYSRDDGRCVKIRVEELCDPGPNEYRTANNRCVCREGYERYGRACVPEREEPRCQPGPNEFRTSRGYCLCREGYERNGRGACVEEFNPIDDCTHSGRIWTGRRCIDPPSPGEICEDRGGRWTGSRCDYGPTPQEVCRQRGGRMIDGDCVFIIRECPRGTEGNYPNCRKVDNDKPKPDVICEREGGKWVRGECQYPHGNTPMEDCIQNGGRWNNGQCDAKGKDTPKDSEAQQCRSRGGTWTGKRCREPAKQCPQGTEGRYPDCKTVKQDKPPTEQPDNGPDVKKLTPAQQCANRGGSYEEGNCVLDKKDNVKPSDDVRAKEKQREIEKEKEKQDLLKQQSEKLQKQKEQQKLEKQQEKQQKEKQENKKQEQLQKLQKQLEKQQSPFTQKQKQQDKAQDQIKGQTKNNGDTAKKEKKDNNKGGGACPPGKFPNPAKGGKCTKPS